MPLLLALAVAAHFAAGWRMMRAPKISFGDGIEYLDAAYHLRRDQTFTSSSDPGTTTPAIGREPGYPLLLAALMALDPGLGSYSPVCGNSTTACDPARCRTLSIVNLVLIEVASLLVFSLAADVTGSGWAGLAGAGYILLNVNLLRFHWYDPMSDPLALALVAGAMLALQRAWTRGGALRWSMAGLVLAALTLTKAVFLPFSFLVAAVVGGRAVVGGASGRAAWRAPLFAAAVYAVLVGGWAARNLEVSGTLRLTDARGGIALSTREVFDHMTPAQEVAAFVYWTPGGGESLAKRLFAPETVAPFELYAPGGFYDRGQNGYGRRVDALMHADGLDAWQAGAAIDKTIVHEILAAPVGYAASTLPLLYRGLWIDQFALVSVPLLVWMFYRACRARDGLIVLLLGFGLFNEAFYTLFSLNIPRYQITAIPALALTAAMVVRVAALRFRSRTGTPASDMRPLGPRSGEVVGP